MRAAVLTEYHKPFEIREIPEPKPGKGEVLVRIEACGICGSDHFLQTGGFQSVLPIVPGHEASGTVIALGEGVSSAKINDDVAVYYIISCGDCRYCLRGQTNLCRKVKRVGVDVQGAAAQYICVPEQNVIAIPKGLNHHEAAVITDAVATPYHALKMGQVQPNDWVMVLGVGGIGSNAVQLAKSMGANVIAVSRSDSKLQLAKKMGADHVVSTDDRFLRRILDLTEGYGVDVSLQCSPSAQMDTAAFQVLANQGRMVAVAANQEPFAMKSVDFIWGEKQIIGSRGFTKQDIQDCMELYQSGRINIGHLLEHTLSLDQINQAISNLSDPQIVRTVIFPNQ